MGDGIACGLLSSEDCVPIMFCFWLNLWIALLEERCSFLGPKCRLAMAELLSLADAISSGERSKLPKLLHSIVSELHLSANGRPALKVLGMLNGL